MASDYDSALAFLRGQSSGYGPRPSTARPTTRTRLQPPDDLEASLRFLRGEDDTETTPEPSGFVDTAKDLWRKATSPIPAIQRATKALSEDVGAGTDTEGQQDPGRPLSIPETLGYIAANPLLGTTLPLMGRQGRAALRGAGAGFLEESVPSVTTPLDLATLPAAVPARTLRGLGKAGTALYRGARGVELAGGAGLGAEGVSEAAEGVREGDLSKVGGGVFRAGMGALMARGGQVPERAAVEALPARLPTELDVRLSEAARPMDPAALQTQPLDVWVGDTPEGFRPPEFMPERLPVEEVSPAAERAFLRPDPEAEANAQTVRSAREFLAGGAMRPALEEAVTTPPVPRLGQRLPDMTGPGVDLVTMSPRAAEVAAEQGVRVEPRTEPLPTSLSRDQAEAQRLAVKVGDLDEAELNRRLRFYRREGMRDSVAAVQAEQLRRAEATPAPEPTTWDQLTASERTAVATSMGKGFSRGAIDAMTPAQARAMIPRRVAQDAPVAAQEAIPAPLRPETVPEPLAQNVGESGAKTENTPEPFDDRRRDAIVDRREQSVPVDTERRLAERRARILAEDPTVPEPLAQRIAEAEDIAETDSITTLRNKRGWDKLLSTVNPETDHVAIVDLKGFKPINDRIGHAAGDEVLKRVGSLMRTYFGDEAARHGGDEFGGVLRNLSPEDASARAEAFREDLRNLRITVRNKITGETLDIPGFEAHIGVARDAEAADLAQNVARQTGGSGRDAPVRIEAAGPRTGGGYPGVEGLGSAAGSAAPVSAAEPGVAGETGPRLGDRPPELAPPRPKLPEPGNVVMPSITTKGPTRPAGSISERNARLIEEQARLLRESGLEDFPLIPKQASEAIFDGEGALKRLQEPRDATAMDLGSAVARGGEVFRDAVTYGASLIERGIRSFPEWSRAMTASLGRTFREIGQHLKALWDAAVVKAKEFGKWMDERYGPSETGALRLAGPTSKPIKPIPPTATPPSAAAAVSTPVQATATPPQAQSVPPQPPPSAPAATAGASTPPAGPQIPGLWGKLLEYRRNALLSGPPTHLVNPASTAGEGAVRSLESAVGGIVDKMMGGPRTRFSGEAREQLKGAVSGLPEAMSRLGKGLKGVLNTEGAIKGTAGKVTRIPQQLMSVEDDAVRALNEQAVLQSFAYREAKRANPNATKAQIEAAQQAIVQNPPTGFMDRVEKEVRSRQFKLDTDPEGWLKKFGEARSKSVFWQVALPFYETPAAIGKLVAERSPAGFVPAIKAAKAYRNALRKGITGDALAEIKGEAVDKLARPIVGTALLGLFSGVAHAGFLTGGGPTDKKERGALLETGWQPYSFKVGDTYVPFNRFEPVSSLLGFAADMAEARNAKDQADLVNKALASVAQNLTSKTYLQGLADAAEFITNPGEAASGFVPGLAASFVPNVVKKTAQAVDPIVRDTRPEAKGLLGTPERAAKTVAAAIPGLSTTLPARRSGTGEVIDRPGNAASRFLSPLQITQKKPGTELEKLLVDIDAVPSAPQREVTIPGSHGRKVRLTDEEYATLQDSDRRASDRLRRLIQRSDFRRLEPEEQRAIIERFYNRERTTARKRLWQSRELRRRASTVMREARA